ncbi:MAG: hypothetical protein AMXMBFR53_21360 [Gemmatimonadota bacterium]
MQPVNLIAAALITQVSLILIVAVGSYSLHLYDLNQTVSPAYRWSGLSWRIFAMAFLTLALLMTSDEFGGLWGPIFNVAPERLIPWSTAILLAFLLDILLVSYLVWISGGAKGSPFSPLFFILPALALFLREPAGHVIGYFSLICVGFSLNMRVTETLGIATQARAVEARTVSGLPNFAYWWVAISSFSLATLVGYITRPA